MTRKERRMNDASALNPTRRAAPASARAIPSFEPYFGQKLTVIMKKLSDYDVYNKKCIFSKIYIAFIQSRVYS
jgi:hypothetical protein